MQIDTHVIAFIVTVLDLGDKLHDQALDVLKHLNKDHALTEKPNNNTLRLKSFFNGIILE